MTANSIKRHHLFDIFSKNLSLVNSTFQDVFICPLCYKKFSREQIDSHLSLAHIWPESLDGNLETLACKECNSKMGSSIESHLTKAIINPFKRRLFAIDDSKDNLDIKSDGGIKITPEISKASLGIKSITFDEDTINTDVFPNPNAKIWDLSFSGYIWVSRKETFKYRNVFLTYLHFSYLYLFHCFGYEWAESLLAKTMRHQLKNPNEKVP